MTHIHASDCAMHNAPVYEVGPCDCGAAMTHPHADLIARLERSKQYCETVLDEVFVNELITALSAPVTLAQAIQCPEVQAMVEALKYIAAGDDEYEPCGWAIRTACAALGPYYGLSASNERKPNAD